MSEMVRSFFLPQEQNCFDETSLRSQKWADVSCTLTFPNDNPWVWLPLIYLTVFLPTDRKRYFEAQTTAFEVLRAIICLMQTGILWWNGFSQSYLATRPVDPFQNQCSNCFFFFRFWCTRNIKFRKTLASFKAESKLSTSSFTEFAILRFFPQQQNVQMTHLGLNRQLELNRGHQELCSWANGVLQNNNDLSRHNLHSPPTPLPIIDRRPPPWWIFLSPPSLPLPLKPKMVAIIFVEKKVTVEVPKFVCRRLTCYFLCKHKGYEQQ